MVKSTLLAGIFALGLIQPVFAEDAMKSDAMMTCDEASLMKAQEDIDKMTGDAMKMQKEEAMKSMAMAMDAMKMNKADECATHLGDAMKAMHKM
jgi:hypothetical protein